MVSLRYGTTSDAKDCCLIAKSCLVSSCVSSHKGFLPLSESEEEYVKSLSDDFSIVATLDNSVIGFLVGFLKGTSNFERMLTQERIAKMECEEKLSFEKTFFIKTIAISSNYRNQGVALKLYHKLFLELQSYAFCGFIIEAPIKNRASILFHQRLGFYRIATSEIRLSKPQPLLEKGSAGLYWKKPTSLKNLDVNVGDWNKSECLFNML